MPLGTPQTPGVGQAGTVPTRRVLGQGAWGSTFSCPQLFRENSFLLIFCTVSFFIFKHTFIYSCAVLETEKGFLGHLSADRETFVPSRQEKGVHSNLVLGCVLPVGWNCLQKQFLALPR